MINFQLKKIEEISPWGSEEAGYNLHWFGLTDSFYWLDLGGHELLRYSDEFMTKHSDHFSSLPYVDYYLIRLIEDFQEIVPFVATSIPDHIFQYIRTASDMEYLEHRLHDWFEGEHSDEEYELIYDPIGAWLGNRKLDTGYLVGGPHLYFLRHGDHLVIRWSSEYQDEGMKMWAEQKGEYVLAFGDFVKEVEDFLERFQSQMEIQLSLAYANLPSDIEINWDLVYKEHEKRKGDFECIIHFLKQGAPEYAKAWTEADHWGEIEQALQIIMEG